MTPAPALPPPPPPLTDEALREIARAAWIATAHDPETEMKQ